MTECPICYEPEKNWRGSTKAVCGHVLCMTCFIAHTKNASACPLCRREYLESQEGDDEGDEETAGHGGLFTSGNAGGGLFTGGNAGGGLFTGGGGGLFTGGGGGMFANFIANQNNVEEQEQEQEQEQDDEEYEDDYVSDDEGEEGCQCQNDECTCDW